MIVSTMQTAVKDALIQALDRYSTPTKMIVPNEYYNGYRLKMQGIYKYVLKSNPDLTIQQMIQQTTQQIDVKGWIITSGKDYIQIDFTHHYITESVQQMLATGYIIPQVPNPKKILVDFSSPNIAKYMHVGHIRSTIIGDSICRLLEAQGHDVHRVNHIGDFGTQFGILIQHMFDTNPNISELDIDNLQTFYAESKKRFDTDPEFKKQAYQRVVDLQSNVPEVVEAWESIKEISRQAYNQIYQRLGVFLDEVGESFYQNMLPTVVSELEELGLVEEEQGMKVVRYNKGKNVLILVKSDGGYTYDTTDLAAIRYRLIELKMDRVYYVVDSGQALHFKMVFDTAKRARWLTSQHVEHVGFGLVVGPDGKRFRSRDGGTVKLEERSDEAVTKAGEVAKDITDTECIEAVAYGAIKYTDLSTTRTKNYQFSFDQMLQMKGDTAPALMYAYVRIASIMRNSGIELGEVPDILNLDAQEEINLMVKLLRFPDTLLKTEETVMFHHICTYMYSLRNLFGKFFGACRCLNYDADGHIVNINMDRLWLCEATRRVMATCLDLLGIKTVDRM